MKLAFVYDWFDSTGGAERLLDTCLHMFPDAPWYTSYISKTKKKTFLRYNPKTSFIQKLPEFIKESRVLSTPLYPLAFESFSFNDYDIVVSITSSFSKGIITRPETRHVCYMFGPTRFLWGNNSNLYVENTAIRTLSTPFNRHLRTWDLVASQRPDDLLTLSNFSKKKIQEAYNRSAQVIYPPFDYNYWLKLKDKVTAKKKDRKSHYLVVSRLEPYKRIDLVVKACNETKKKVVIIGQGSLEKSLKNYSSEYVFFKNNLTDSELAHEYTQAKALIMPQEEDFGYTALEASFFGCPVISYKQSGVREIITDQTGIFFNKQSVPDLIGAIEKYEQLSYTLLRSTQAIGGKVIDKFTEESFKLKFQKLIMNS